MSVQKHADLVERMRALHLCERDIEENYLKHNGVNLLHRPSGVRVRCGRERSQGLNRFLARRLLVDELEARQVGKTRHLVKAEQRREEKERRGDVPRRAARAGDGASPADPLGGTHLFDPNGSAMSAYFLRALPR